MTSAVGVVLADSYVQVYVGRVRQEPPSVPLFSSEDNQISSTADGSRCYDMILCLTNPYLWIQEFKDEKRELHFNTSILRMRFAWPNETNLSLVSLTYVHTLFAREI